MNEYDSNRIIDLVKLIGYEKTNNQIDADCCVLNTCHIRSKATEKVYSEIGRVKKNFKNIKKPLVIVAGCVAQAESEEMLKRDPYIDMVIGPQSYHEINDKILNYFRENKKINLTEFNVIKKFDELEKIKNSDSKISSFLTIQEGCDKFCNFCVVPYTRGPEYSRSFDQIISEAKILVANGSREITLLGQNVNAYHFKSGGKEYKLSNLLLELEKIRDLVRIRFTTSHPKDMTEDLIDCFKNCSKLMPFLHLPVQSGSNKILKISGDISEDTNAPSMVPGTAIKPSFQPSESSIRFCLAYIAVDATELLNTANRLLLTANVGENPMNVNIGTIIIPPPKPIIDPNIPATNPSGINQSCSNILYRYYFHFGIFCYIEFVNKTCSDF